VVAPTPYLDAVWTLVVLGVLAVQAVAAGRLLLTGRAGAARLLGLALVVQALAVFNAFQTWFPGDPVAVGRTTVDFRLVMFGAIVAALARYPRPPPVRSWHGAVVAGAAAYWCLAVLAYLASRAGWFAPDVAPFVDVLSFTLGWRPVLLALLVSAVLRAEALPGPERRAAWFLAPALVLLPQILGGNAASALRDLTGVQPGWWTGFVEAFSSVPGDCCGLTLGLWLVELLGTAAFAAVAYARFGQPGPALLVGGAALVSLATSGGAYRYDMLHFAWAPLLALHAASREALPVAALPRRAALAVGATVLVAVFLVVNGTATTLTTESLGLSVGVFLGLALGAAAAASALPAGSGLGAPGGAPPGDAHVAAYRRALQGELRQGLQGEALASKLRDLRADLGVSDRDHALLEHVARAEGGQGRAGAALVPGSTLLGRYRILRQLGEGSAGRTFLAEDTMVHRRVVLKALRADADEDPSVLREARALAALQHPRVVTLYDVERVGDQVFVVMEHLPGGSLADRLAKGPLAPGELAPLALGLLEALEAIHRAGLVHRDVKPSNVLLTAQGLPKLADFGIAQLPGAEATIAGVRGAPLGTLRFMSPEQARGMRATPRSDLYSAAATLHEAATGRPYLEPRAGETAADLQLRAAFPSRPGGDPRVPPALRPWFAKALHPDPGKRFASASAMRKALARALGHGRGSP
jgi:hypothetical protein